MQTRNMTNEELLKKLVMYTHRLNRLYSASDAVKYEEVYNEILRRLNNAKN